MEARFLLDTPLIVSPGMSDQEIDFLWQQTYLRSLMTQRFVDGVIDVETFLDFMAEQGYEPCELLDQAEENLAYAQAEGINLIL